MATGEYYYSSDGTDSTTASTDAYDVTWKHWNVGGTAGPTTYYSTNGSSAVWENWTTDTADSGTSCGSVDTETGVFVWKTWVAETEEQRREREQRQLEYEESRQAERRQAEAAENRAKELLMILIGPKELKIYEETGRVFVKGVRFDYMVHKGGRIDRIEKDKITDICCHLRNMHEFPQTDNVVAVKLHIEADEEGFLKTANLHGSRDLPSELPLAACM